MNANDVLKYKKMKNDTPPIRKSIKLLTKNDGQCIIKISDHPKKLAALDISRRSYKHPELLKLLDSISDEREKLYDSFMDATGRLNAVRARLGMCPIEEEE